MISTTKIEDVSLPKSDSRRNLPYTKVRAGHKEYESNRKLHCDKKKQSPASLKFKRAFNSAIIARSAFLKRRLTRQEWVALKKAVLHQCTRGPTDKLSRKLNEIQRQVNTVEQLVPTDISSAFASLEMFKLQMDVLRRQMYSAILENDTLSETCPHFRLRRIYHVPFVSGESLYFRHASLQSIISYKLDGKLEQLCCHSCLEKRSDAFFEWTGSSLTMLDAEDASPILDRKDCASLKTVHPLSIQSIWTGFVTAKFRSTHGVPDSAHQPLRTKPQTILKR